METLLRAPCWMGCEENPMTTHPQLFTIAPKREQLSQSQADKVREFVKSLRKTVNQQKEKQCQSN